MGQERLHRRGELPLDQVGGVVFFFRALFRAREGMEAGWKEGGRAEMEVA